jgi:hypothetical protein
MGEISRSRAFHGRGSPQDLGIGADSADINMTNICFCFAPLVILQVI